METANGFPELTGSALCLSVAQIPGLLVPLWAQTHLLWKSVVTPSNELSILQNAGEGWGVGDAAAQAAALPERTHRIVVAPGKQHFARPHVCLSPSDPNLLDAAVTTNEILSSDLTISGAAAALCGKRRELLQHTT